MHHYMQSIHCCLKSIEKHRQVCVSYLEHAWHIDTAAMLAMQNLSAVGSNVDNRVACLIPVPLLHLLRHEL